MKLVGTIFLKLSDLHPNCFFFLLLGEYASLLANNWITVLDSLGRTTTMPHH